jgi:hypothetical protein
MEYNILQLGMMCKPLVAFRRQPTFRLQAKVVEFELLGTKRCEKS